jgi:hypothetical protein
MPINTLSDLLTRFLYESSSPAIKEILEEVGDSSDIGLDTPFGQLNLFWHPYGGNSSNWSTIGLATKAGRSLTERITNAIDAVLEERAAASPSKPTSPQRAASEWFGRPITGADSGLYNWEYSDGQYDKKVAVVLLRSENENAPTIDVLDYGIGLSAEQFPKTILSLQSGNKLDKKYLLGAFGQGGSSTLAFSEYALIFSRSKQHPSKLAFTLVRVLSLGDDYKEDCFAYLAIKDDEGNVVVPSIEFNSDDLSIYRNLPSRIKLSKFSHGTLVRHYSYKLQETGTLSPQPGNLYHFLHFSMFDTLLPFRVIDLRENGKEKVEVVKGSRNRLMTYAEKSNNEEDENTGRTQLKHYRPMEYVAPIGFEPCVGIEYWVVFNHEKKPSGEYRLRKDTSALYVQKKFPIVATMNGQTQGEMPAHLLREMGLSLISRYIVIHIDATKVPTKIRRDLFATTREGFKEGPVLSSIMQVLEKMLREDDKLFILEKELTEKLTSKEAETANEEVRKQITKLLLDAGFTARAEGQALSEGKGEMLRIPREKTKAPRVVEPLPTLPFPQVTRFEIVTPKPIMKIHINDSEIILVETDADAEFDKRSLIGIRFDPSLLEIASKSPLRGGRIRWRLRAVEGAQPGATGKIHITITRLDGTQIIDGIDYELLPEVEKRTKHNKGSVPPFDVKPVSPDEEAWSLLVWSDLEDTDEKNKSVAYKPITQNDGAIIVYYSTVFPPFNYQVEKLKLQSEALLNLFETNYKVWIGYHAILQQNENQNSSSGLDEDVQDKLFEEERARVAQIQVKQAMKSAELMHRLSKEQSVAGID